MIKIQNLTAGYGKTIVLSHINLELKNETYGIIGPNGSGKTISKFINACVDFAIEKT